MLKATDPRTGDAFGELVRSQWTDLTQPRHEIVERDDGFVDVTDARIYFTGARPSEMATRSFRTRETAG